VWRAYSSSGDGAWGKGVTLDWGMGKGGSPGRVAEGNQEIGVGWRGDHGGSGPVDCLPAGASETAECRRAGRTLDPGRRCVRLAAEGAVVRLAPLPWV
jgi:hypothetical protein